MCIPYRLQRSHIGVLAEWQADPPDLNPKGAGEDRLNLFSMSVAGGAEKTIGSLGSEYGPARLFRPALRLSLSPDGKSLAYSTSKSTSNLWLIEGLDTVALP